MDKINVNESIKKNAPTLAERVAKCLAKPEKQQKQEGLLAVSVHQSGNQKFRSRSMVLDRYGKKKFTLEGKEKVYEYGDFELLKDTKGREHLFRVGVNRARLNGSQFLERKIKKVKVDDKTFIDYEYLKVVNEDDMSQDDYKVFGGSYD